MRLRRFFVTYVAFMGIALAVAFNITMPLVGATSRARLAQEGNLALREAEVTQTELAQKYQLLLSKVSNGENTPEHFNYKKLSKAQRREVQGWLAHFLSRIHRVLEIDAKDGITVENRAVMLNARDTAERLQKAIENFERVYGENFEPKSGGSGEGLRSQHANFTPDKSEVDGEI